jgi:DNA-binding response OmpR family regulator
MSSLRPVLVVEDDRKTADIIRLYLERDGYDVEVVHDGPSALEMLERVVPLAVVLDIMLPGASGLDVCRQVRRQGEVPVLIVSARTGEQDRLSGLHIGADDYITKPFSPRELVARLRAVLRRSGVGSEPVPGLRLDPRAHIATWQGAPLPLTPTEFRILGLFVKSGERVFTRDEVIRRAMPEHFDGMDRTVDAHVMNIRRKVRRAGGPDQIIATVFGVGYRLGGHGS